MSTELHIPTAAPALLRRKSRLVKTGILRLFAILAFWHGRVLQRRALGRLDARLLDDIGLSPDEARQEIGRPFWR